MNNGVEFNGSLQSFINDTIIAAVVEVFLNGIYTAVILTTFCIVVSRHSFRHLFKPLIIVIFGMYIIATVSAWAQISVVTNVLLRRHSSPKSPAEITAMLIPQRWQNIFILLAYPVNGVVADCIMIWRCYIIWGRNKRIILIASVLTFAQIPFVILTLLWDLQAFTGYHQSFSFFKTLATSSTSLSLASTVVTSVLVMYRIISVGGWKYFPFIEIMVESALLYSITLICIIPFGFLKTIHAFIPAAVNRQITGIAPTLIIVRLLLGVKTLEQKKFATPLTGLRNTTSGSDSHPMTTIRFHPSFTDPSKTMTDEAFRSTSVSKDDHFNCRPREMSPAFIRSKHRSRGESVASYDDHDDEWDDHSPGGISSRWYENALSPPLDGSTSKSNV